MPKAFDALNPPFDRLTHAEVEELRAVLDIGYLAPGETAVELGKPSDHLHVIIKGAVEELDERGDVNAVLGAKDSFDPRAVVHGAAGSRFRAVEETLVYLVPRETVLSLVRRNPRFAAYFYSEISRRIEAMARADVAEGVDSVLRARVHEARPRPAVFVDASATIEEAGHAMRDADCNTLFVKSGDRIGVVTGMNLSKGVVLQRKPLETPVGDVTNWEVVALGENDFVFEALMLMTKHNKRRLAVTRDGVYTGVIEDIDILGLFAGNSQLIPGRIDRAHGLDDLEIAARDIQAQVDSLHRQGVKVDVIAEMTSDLNRQLFARLFDMVAPETIRRSGALMIMGSEGRGEQTVRTDQDNGLLLAGPVPEEDLKAFRRDFSGALERFGFPPCPGDVMVSNPVWSATIEDFTAQIRRWVLSPTEESPMHLGIFFDAVCVAGDQRLVERAKREFVDMMRGESAYLAHFAMAIDQFPGPGGVINALLASVGREEPMDLKKIGIFPIVHGIRSLSIEKGIAATPTVDRIERLTDTGLYDAAFARELIGAFRYFMELRLRSQLRAARRGTTEGESLVQPSELNSLDRDLLRDALKVVRQFRDIVRSHYKLGLF
jgi:CBS domain-containing protein